MSTVATELALTNYCESVQNSVPAGASLVLVQYRQRV